MNKKSLIGVSIVVVFVALIASWYFFGRPAQVINTSNEPFEMSGAFVGPENVTKSADTLTLSRVLRGYVDRSTVVNDQTSYFISAQINWPDEEPQQMVVVQVLPQTEFLCWPSATTTADGTVTEIKDMVFLLDDSHKLFIEGQLPILPNDRAEQLKQGSPVVIALQEPYSDRVVSNAFQIAVVGCQ